MSPENREESSVSKIPRINFNMSIPEVLVAMCEGNPGALTVCIEAIKNAERIDPDSAFGGLGVIMFMDDLGVYGSRIWMLFKDVCKEDLTKMLAVIRARQLGLGVTAEMINVAIDNGGEGLDPDKCLSDVRQRLPAFASNK